MVLMSDSSRDSESDWDLPAPKKKRKAIKPNVKRRKLANGRGSATRAERQPTLLPSLDPLLSLAELDSATEERCFEDTILDLLPDLLQTRAILQERETEITETVGVRLFRYLCLITLVRGARIRPLTRGEVSLQLQDRSNLTPIAARKLKLASAAVSHAQFSYDTGSITPIPSELPSQVANKQVLDALEAIETTAFENSFLARLYGPSKLPASPIVAVDWTIETPWMRLITDIWAHYSLAHPEREQVGGTLAPITFVSLNASHLEQVHDLLARAFWPGIDVSDSLDFSPDKCTIVAMYKHLVVGVAIMSSPRETYITYLVVRAGWDNSHIARCMLYHLVQLNPKKDITLHVSANNSAMLLYNRFGFKAEEFVVGFYDEYLSPNLDNPKMRFGCVSGNSSASLSHRLNPMHGLALNAGRHETLCTLPISLISICLMFVGVLGPTTQFLKAFFHVDGFAPT